MASRVKMMSSDPMSRLAATSTKQKVLVAESRSDEAGPLVDTKVVGSSTRPRRHYRLRMGCVVCMTSAGSGMHHHPSTPSDHQKDASILLQQRHSLGVYNTTPNSPASHHLVNMLDIDKNSSAYRRPGRSVQRTALPPHWRVLRMTFEWRLRISASSEVRITSEYSSALSAVKTFFELPHPPFLSFFVRSNPLSNFVSLNAIKYVPIILVTKGITIIIVVAASFIKGADPPIKED